MSIVVDWLSSIAENIISLPVKIIEGILNGIKEIFIPDFDEIKNTFEATLDNIASIIGLPIDSVKDAFDSITDQPVKDINGDYTISGVGTMKLTFFDTAYLRNGIDYFRPILRGFIVLLLFFYNYSQILSFIGQDPRVYGGSSDSKGGNKE